MAKVKNNLLTEGLSGKIGKRLVFRQMRDGRTIVVTRPDFSNRVFSDEQLTHQNRFQQASAYAKVAAKTQPLYAELAQRIHKPAYNIALSDWFHAPIIHAITRQDRHIYVDVTDNVHIANVLITLLDEQGQALEQAQAVWLKDARWEYETFTPGKVIVEAFDLAGNCTRQEEYTERQ